MNERKEFSKKTKDIIARRAGYRCSFPGCSKTLVGPGRYSNETIIIGEYCHIFSADAHGPRGDGGLSEEELKRPENGIFLCRNHHKLVDSNEGNQYPSEVLIRYKNRHEFIIAAEIGEYIYPLNWINTVKVTRNDIIPNDIEINFGKLTHIKGAHGSGKTMLLEILQSCFEQKIVKRWKKSGINFQIEVHIDNPIIQNYKFGYENNKLYYFFDNKPQAFVPYSYKVVSLINNLMSESDDINMIANCLNIDRDFLRSFIEINKEKIGITTSGYEIVTARTKPYTVEELYVEVGNDRRQKLSTCSGSELGRVIYDITIAIAKELSVFHPVLLIMDWLNISISYDKILENYLQYLSSHDNHFQVIMITTGIHDPGIWLGWETVEFIETEGGLDIKQCLK